MATYKGQVSEQLLKRGNELYQAMISNFDEIFDGDHIRHFRVRSIGVYDLGSEKVMEEHGDNIKKELLLWIDNEYKGGDLFVISNWRMCHDRYSSSYMYIGYKKLFQFKNYYFGLLFNTICMKDIKDCIYCMKHEYGKTFDKEYHFQLLLYGWKGKDGIFHGNKKFVNLESNTISENYWNAV
jgi:hypothetical protein